MSYLLDTCVLSRLRKLEGHPDKKLKAGISRHSDSQYFTSVLSIGEIQARTAKLNAAKKEQQLERMLLEDWLFRDLIPWCQDRILAIDSDVILRWGKMFGESKRNQPSFC